MKNLTQEELLLVAGGQGSTKEERDEPQPEPIDPEIIDEITGGGREYTF